MSRQVIPVYTSMEGMKTEVHDLTDEEMKSITFQIIPQLYWRYEWSYNDFMIHRVGRAYPVGPYEMYDMLGNVWELVRDKWSLLSGSTPDGYNWGVADYDPTEMIPDTLSSSGSNFSNYGGSDDSDLANSDDSQLSPPDWDGPMRQRGLWIDGEEMIPG